VSEEKSSTIKAVAYMRTSSAANVGVDKDSEQRQRVAIEKYASHNGIVIVDWFYDPAVSGADPITERPSFQTMLERLAGNGIRTILVETANRFARDLMVQEVGYTMLIGLGISLVAVDSPDAFLNDTPTAVLIRQILGAVAQFDKAMAVAKLKGARDRKRATGVKVEGRKSHQEARPEVVAIAKKLRRQQKLTLRVIAERLEALGYVNNRGQRYNPNSIKSMLEGESEEN
jgi:DNA invertase Pin-like site-specific DNA recombinase